MAENPASISDLHRPVISLLETAHKPHGEWCVWKAICSLLHRIQRATGRAEQGRLLVYNNADRHGFQ
jgi:hypothetical protein